MTRRTYGQFCPVAYSLDLIGERWTLLVIRELMFGPRRFTDLFRGLPGIGKNLLSRRLSDLEGAGVIQRRDLPPPAPAAVYELTPYGQELKPILADFSRWGLRWMTAESFRGHYLSVPALMNAFTVLFDVPAAEGTTLVGEFQAGAEVFQARIQAGELALAPGAAENADFQLQASPKILLQLLIGVMGWQEAQAAGELILVIGDGSGVEAFLQVFSFPDGFPDP